MFLQLLKFEFDIQSKQKALPIFGLVYFLLGLFKGGIGQAPAQVHFNSGFEIAYSSSLFSLGCVFVIMFFSVAAAIRDKKYNMEQLIFSTPIKKSYFFWSRFLGAFIFSIISFFPFLPGFFTGLHIADLDPSRMMAFNIYSYVWPLFAIIIPNIFICTALIFATSLLTKSNLATYTSAVLIYILYFVIAFYSNSPVMAASIPASPESMANAALLDPFAIATFLEHTHFWTPVEKNTIPLNLEGNYLWNRVLWCTFSLLVLGIAYWVFSFRKTNQKVKNKKGDISEIKEKSTYFLVSTATNARSQWSAFLSSLKIDSIGIYKSLPFLVIVLMLTGASIFELYSRIFEGGSYGDSWYPYTNLLLEIVLELLPMLSLILIIFYSGELMWKERDKKMEGLIFTSPAKNWTFFLAKFTALALLPLILITIIVAVCIAFQIVYGHTKIDFFQYLNVYYFEGVQLTVSCMIAIFIQSMTRNKFLGMGITGFVLLFLGTSLSGNLGIEHPMFSVGNIPVPIYSNMAGYSVNIGAFIYWAIYWLSFGLILSIISYKYWNREIINTKSKSEKIPPKKWSVPERMSALFFCITFLLSGIYIYNKINIENTYMNSDDRMDYAENYEKKFKMYDSLERLHYTDMKTIVDIYPSEEKYSVQADYILINKNKTSVDKVFISERKILSDIHIENARLAFRDTTFGTYLFELDAPLLPQETIRMTYSFTKQSQPFKVDRTIVKNGTYIRHDMFEPALAYRSSLELSDNHERKKRGLPIKINEVEGDAHMTAYKAQYGKVNFETTVSTSLDQKALAPGGLVKQWTVDGRNYFKYTYKDKNIPALAYFSSNYEKKKDSYRNIDLEYYYHPGHDMNHETINRCTKKTLEYCNEQFAPYPFEHLRIAEIPSHFHFGGAAHPGLINMVEDNLYLIDIRKERTFDLVSKRTIHEVAHQWWGMLLMTKNVSGASFIIEGFTKYTEGVVLEKLYGKGALWELNKQANLRYFRGRTFAREKEPPVYLENGQSYLSYGKDILIMLSLRDLMSEDSLNMALRALIENDKSNEENEITTLDFIQSLYNYTPEKNHALIEDWMKKIIRYDLSIGESKYEKLANGRYEVTFDVKAQRYETSGDGTEKEIAIREPLSIGLFTDHPSNLGLNEKPIYLQPHSITQDVTEIRIEVEQLPSYIGIDPFLTRPDRVYSDNIKRLDD